MSQTQNCNCNCQCPETPTINLPIKSFVTPGHGMSVNIDAGALEKLECKCLEKYLPPENLYVAVDGNDGNDGLSWGTAFRTIQAAVDETGKYSRTGSCIIVNIGPGAYDKGAVIDFSTHYHNLMLLGESTTRVAAVGDRAFSASGPGTVHISNLNIESTTSCIHCGNSGFITVTNSKLTAKSSSGIAIHASAKSNIKISKENEIYCDSCSRAIYATCNSYIAIANDLKINGSVSKCLIESNRNSTIFRFSNSEVSGTVTGKRYDCSYNGVLEKSGNTPYPGTIEGTVSTGGAYTT